MFNIVYRLMETHGATIIEIVLLLLLVFSVSVIYKLIKKIATNHLKHIQEALDKVLGKVSHLENGFNNIDKRVSILESKED